MKPFVLFLGVLFLSQCIVFGSQDVGAMVADSLWISGEVMLIESNEVAFDESVRCPTLFQDVFIRDFGEKRRTCISGDHRMRFGMATTSQAPVPVIAYRFDQEMQRLHGACAGTACLYSAEQDVLVTMQQIGPFAWGVVAYGNVSQRISRVTGSDGLSRYIFDNRLPDYELKKESGHYIWSSAFALSENGRWLVVELNERGVAVVDMASFTARQLTVEGGRYGFGRDPQTELAITNDGKTVMVTGNNAGSRVISVTDSCGQRLMYDLGVLPGSVMCPFIDGVVSRFVPNFHSAHNPRFNDSGDAVSVSVSAWGGSMKRLLIGKPGLAVPPRLQLLSLGDSFVSGEGETDDTMYFLGTDTGTDTCRLSRRSYPFLIATMTGVVDQQVRSVACAGARISDISDSPDSYWGQSDRLGSAGRQLNVAEKTAVQAEAARSFQPGHTPQQTFVEQYRPRVVTIGVGGNDAGLMGKLKTCAMPGTCEWARPEGRGKTAGEIRALFDRLVTLYGRLIALSPDSKIYAVGYPRIINTEGYCDPVTSVLFDKDERLFMKQSMTYLNQVIRAASQRAGIAFIDIEDPIGGKELCNGGESTAINGLRTGDEVAVIRGFPNVRVIGSASYHPTPLGHRLIAEAIVSRYSPLSTHQWCLDSAASCPVNIEPPDPPEYWHSGTSHQEIKAFEVEFAHKVVGSVRDFQLKLPENSLLPGSGVIIEIQSQPTRLGEFIVAENGSIDATASVPESVSSGFHTLHIYGTGVDGGLVDIYQFVT
ncbi:SGNH/GDSL hydrolase family protein, partial [Candidatus Saccharibacteria bacterium]|nr:SGNH/GDSL hydrolase family protein [Candidatus Saccharibacteria bacterium]